MLELLEVFDCDDEDGLEELLELLELLEVFDCDEELLWLVLDFNWLLELVLEGVDEELELLCFQLELRLELVVLTDDELGGGDELDGGVLVGVVVGADRLSVFVVSALMSCTLFQSRTPPKAGMATARRRRDGLTMMGSVV